MLELLINNWPIVFVVAAVLLALLVSKFSLVERKMPYEKRPSMLTGSELVFYQTLQQAVDGQWSVLAMVRLADVIRVRSKTSKYQSWQNRIQAKHLDFVLCDHASMEARLALELDDKTHERPDRIARDEFVDQALADAGVPLLRVRVEESYDAGALRSAIDQHIA